MQSNHYNPSKHSMLLLVHVSLLSLFSIGWSHCLHFPSSSFSKSSGLPQTVLQCLLLEYLNAFEGSMRVKHSRIKVMSQSNMILCTGPQEPKAGLLSLGHKLHMAPRRPTVGQRLYITFWHCNIKIHLSVRLSSYD